jgi:hypothetical protein
MAARAVPAGRSEMVALAARAALALEALMARMA